MATNKTRYDDPNDTSSLGHRLRAELGLTQAELAMLLSVSRVALAQAENESRSLPASAQRLLFELRQLLREKPAPPPPPLPAPDEAQRHQLARRLQAIGLQEYPLSQQLARLYTRLAQMRRRRQLGAALHEQLPASPDRPRRALQSLLQEAEGLLDLDAGAPALLELRLRVLAFERAEIDKLLG